jgi:hypothetical protein
MPKKAFQLESAIMGAVLVTVILGGLYFVFAETAGTPGPRDVNHNLKRYEEKSLHHVAKELLSHKAIDSLKTQHKEVWSLAVTEQGLYVSGDDGVHHYDSDGELLMKLEAGKSVRFVGEGEQGKLLICQGQRVLIYQSNGTLVKTLDNTSFQRPNAVIEKNGEFYIADRSARIIFHVDHNGDTKNKFGHLRQDNVNNFVIPGPHMDLSLSPDGLIYATNPGRHQVKAYNTEGQLVNVIGKPSFRHNGFCGCCNPVAMTVLRNGDIITTEKGICRVKALNHGGLLKSIIAPPVDFRANKHAFMIDVVEGPKGLIYLLNSDTQEVHIYKQKDPGHA